MNETMSILKNDEFEYQIRFWLMGEPDSSYDTVLMSYYEMDQITQRLQSLKMEDFISLPMMNQDGLIIHYSRHAICTYRVLRSAKQ